MHGHAWSPPCGRLTVLFIFSKNCDVLMIYRACMYGVYQRRYDIRVPLCAIHVIKIVVNAQTYMGAWAWNVNVKAHACRISSGGIHAQSVPNTYNYNKLASGGA